MADGILQQWIIVGKEKSWAMVTGVMVNFFPSPKLSEMYSGTNFIMRTNKQTNLKSSHFFVKPSTNLLY